MEAIINKINVARFRVIGEQENITNKWRKNCRGARRVASHVSVNAPEIVIAALFVDL